MKSISIQYMLILIIGFLCLIGIYRFESFVTVSIIISAGMISVSYYELLKKFNNINNNIMEIKRKLEKIVLGMK